MERRCIEPEIRGNMLHRAKGSLENRQMRKTVLTAMAMITIQVWACSNLAYGENFSCPFGRQGACLEYGAKVCSSTAKCVSDDAVCFDSYTCGYQGFICKSKFDDLVTEYDDLRRKCRNIASEHDDLVVKYNELLGRYQELESCISYASSLEDVQACY